RRAVARRRLDVDAAVHRADVALDHVHADAAARNVGHLLRGREARREDELPDVAVGHAVGNGQAVLPRLGQDAFAVETAAVVADLDDDVAAAVRRAQQQAAGLALAGPGACLGHFDAVVHAVAHQVR